MLILQTKVHLPKPPAKVVHRQRLLDQLTAAIEQEHRLLLVAAPAGFGKTTVVTSWLNSLATNSKLSSHVAWLSLDKDDRSPNRFLLYVVAALETAVIPLPLYLKEQLQSNEPPSSEITLIELLNSLANFGKRSILVLEDYHLTQNKEIDELVTYLLEHAPPMFHLVIVTRVDPNLRFSRLRLRQQMTELRAYDLRFTQVETAQFFTTNTQLALSNKQIKVVETRTEGWVAGLQLVGLSLQNSKDAEQFVQNFAESNRFVMDYLVDEVLHQLPETTQQFLLKTSLLDRFCASLCDYVVKERDEKTHTKAFTVDALRAGRGMLENLAQANLFLVELDNTHTWFRYHHLFQALLRQRIQQGFPEIAAQVHKLAAEWLYQNEQYDEALTHALAAADRASVEQIGAAIARRAFSNGRIAAAKQAIETAQAELVTPSVHLQIYQGWLHAFLGEHHQIPKLAQTQGELGAINGRHAEPDLLALSIGLDGIVAAFAQNDEVAISNYQQGLALLQTDDNIVRHMLSVLLGLAEMRTGNYWTGFQRLLTVFDPAVFLHSTHLPLETLITLNGLFDTPDGVTQFLETAVHVAHHAETTHQPPSSGLVWIYIYLGRDHYYKNQLVDARRLFERAVKLSKQLGENGMGYFDAHADLARLYQTIGHHKSAEAIVERLFILNDPTTNAGKQLASPKLRFLIEKGAVVEAQGLAAACNLSSNDLVSPLQVGAYDAFASLLLAQKQYEIAHALFQRCLQLHKIIGLVEREITNQVQIACALYGMRQETQARYYLKLALKRAAPLGYSRCFLDVNQEYAPLLPSLHHIAPQFVDTLIGLIKNGRFDPNTQLVEPLSVRELEILTLIAQGNSNQAIAKTLTLSVGTIKKHAANIYGKLGVNSRTMAVAQAQSLGLIITNLEGY